MRIICSILILFTLIITSNTIEAQHSLQVQQLIDSTKSYWSLDKEKALFFANKAIQQCDSNNYEQYGECIKNIGVIYYFNNMADSATINYEKALSYFKKGNSKIGISKVLNNLGVLKMETGEYNSALAYYTQSLEIATSLNDTLSIIRSTINISNIYYSLGNYSLALNSCLKYKNLINTINDAYLRANYISSIYSNYKELNDIKNAKKYAQQALNIYEELKDSIGIATTYLNMANIFELTNQFNKAKQLNKNALSIFDNYNYTIGIIHAKKQLGNVYRNTKQYKISTNYFNDALKISINTKLKKHTKDIANDLYINYLLVNDLEKSRHYQHLSDSINNILVNDEIESHLAKYQTKFETLEKEQKIKQQELQLQNERKTRQLITILALFLFSAGSGFIILYRIKQKQKQTQLARTKAEIENRLLRVQMNPHFMFNSLNSVQSYIASNQNELAEDYLARFAQLTRAILNNSREDFIQLSNEIETLETYLKLEQQRFNKKFTFNINIDDELDEDIIKIPPMLIQPFVENAIIHGVVPLKTNGVINLLFKINENENSIICIVEDNGIGIIESMKINKGSKHKSLGIQVTKERFMLIKEQTGIDVSVNTQNLKQGTKVILSIPFISN